MCSEDTKNLPQKMQAKNKTNEKSIDCHYLFSFTANFHKNMEFSAYFQLVLPGYQNVEEKFWIQAKERLYGFFSMLKRHTFEAAAPGDHKP